jgi:DNA-binding MarR family transcriptional regulator
MKKSVLVKDPETLKLFTNKDVLLILSLFLKEEMTNAQIAKAIGKHPQQTIRIITSLKEAGLIEQTKTDTVRNLIEKYYRAKAKQIILDLSNYSSFAIEIEKQ